MVAALAVKESLVMGVQAPLAGKTTWKKTLCETKSLALLEFLMAVGVLLLPTMSPSQVHVGHQCSHRGCLQSHRLGVSRKVVSEDKTMGRQP